jgi:hypothetical protein
MSTPQVQLLPSPSPGQRVVNMTWTTPAPSIDPTRTLKGYYVWFNLYNSTGPTILSQGYRMMGAATAAASVPLPDTAQYLFCVSAFDDLGRESSPSNVVADPPLPPPITQTKSPKPKHKKHFFNQKKKGGESSQ